jgi:hypothetical protein
MQAMSPSGGPADLDVVKPTIVAIGNSHLMSVWDAAHARNAADLPFRVVCLRFIVPEYQPYFIGEDNQRVLNPDFRIDVKKLIESERPAAVLCFSSGSFAFALGAFKSPRPFDFAVPGRDDLALMPDAEVIPYDLMIQAAQIANPWWSQIISAACGHGSAPVYSVCIPPPVASFDQIPPELANADIRSKIETLGEAPKSLRYKMWLVQAATDRQKALTAGAGFLPPPSAALDNSGCRRVEFSGDLLHANVEYGRLIIRQVAEIANPASSGES